MTFDSTYELLTNCGLDSVIAKAAAEILIRDDPTKEYCGRSEKDRQIITTAWTCITKQKGAEEKDG